jgi:hypothetical protein
MNLHSTSLPLFRSGLAAALLLAAALHSSADQRRFAYSYPATTSPKGTIEMENFVTWSHRLGDEKKFDRFQFRHAVEIGVTDRFQVELYPANWSFDSLHRSARYDESGFELIYNLTNPTTSWLGSALYLEVTAGEHALSVEGKLLLQKNIGPFTIGYNAILESEWEGERFGHFDEENGEFAQTFGISYDITKRFSVGIEALHEVELPDWRDSAPSLVYAGPNASVRFSRSYLSVAGIFQLTDL